MRIFPRWTAFAVPALVTIAALSATAASPPDGQVAVTRPPVTTDVSSGPLTARPHEKEIAFVASRMLTQFHYSKHQLDDEISARWLDNTIDQLDPNRSVFLQSDIDSFEVYRTKLDDAVTARPPSVEPALAIYERYRQRMGERIDVVRRTLAGPIDLTNRESFVPDRKDAGLGWPATTEEANDWWRRHVEDMFIGEMLAQGDADEPLSEPEIASKLAKRYDRLDKDIHAMESVDVLEVWLNAMGQSFDPHSGWFKPARSDDFDIDITNSVEGIGAQLGTDDEHTVIEEIIDGGPAAKSELLKKKDKIIGVAQGGGEFVDVVGLRLDKVVQLIRGPKGTEVRLQVLPAGAPSGHVEVVSLVRDRVVVGQAESKIEEVGGRKLGVVTLPNFYVEPEDYKNGLRAATVTGKLLRELDAAGVEGVILDLRRNGGGSLVEAIEVAGLFLPGGPVVQIRGRDGDIEALHDTDPSVAWDGPLVVLVDPTSASASEIVAGALQDYGRAIVVGGAQTHGKGTVQQLLDVDPHLSARHPDGVGGRMKLTIQKFYRVSGGSTQSRGVASDVVLPTWWDGLEVYESDLDYAMPWDRIPPAPHVRTGDPTSLVPTLREKSAARVAASEEFDLLERKIAERIRMEDQQEVSLVLADRRAEHDALMKAIGEDDEKEEERDEEDDDEYVLDEALAVLVDYVDAL